MDILLLINLLVLAKIFYLSQKVNTYVQGMIIHKMVIVKALIEIRIYFMFQFRSIPHSLLVRIVNFSAISKEEMIFLI